MRRKAAMNTKRRRSTSLLTAVCVLAIAFGRPSTADAAIDWIGWFEGFSGPGPSQGFDLSFEFACLDVVQHREVKLEDIEKVLAKTPSREDQSAVTAAAVLGFGFDSAGKQVAVPSTTKRTLQIFGAGGNETTIRSCHRARKDIEKQLRDEQMANGALVAGLASRGTRAAPAPKPPSLLLSRRDWQTGLVLGMGRYTSVQNVLFDPNGTMSGASDEPQLRTVPIELLAHSRLSPAVDVGAGLGVAWFQTQTRDGVQVGANRFAFYYVPFSVVIKPGAMFVPDNRFAAAIGYRFAVRRYGALDGTYFGTTKDAFKGQGEFVWGYSVYFDVLTLAGK
jgi:hypothetical protein